MNDTPRQDLLMEFNGVLGYSHQNGEHFGIRYHSQHGHTTHTYLHFGFLVFEFTYSIL